MDTKKENLKKLGKFVKDEAKQFGLTPKVNESSLEARLDEIEKNDTIIDGVTYEDPKGVLMVEGYFEKWQPGIVLGEISMVTGKSGAKKSYMINMIASALVGNIEIDGKIRGELPMNKRHVYIIDTEQGKSYVARRKRIIQSRASTNDNITTIAMRRARVDELVGMVYRYANKPNCGVIVIDQIGDLVTSLNSESEAIVLQKALSDIAEEKGVAILIALHENKGDGLASGWLGTHLLKKAITVWSIQKDDGSNSQVLPTKTRDAEFVEMILTINEDGFPSLIPTVF